MWLIRLVLKESNPRLGIAGENHAICASTILSNHWKEAKQWHRQTEMRKRA
jgi:hypothetical protein